MDELKVKQISFFKFSQNLKSTEVQTHHH